MVKIDDVDFFSHLQQLWSKSTGAEDMYWMPEQPDPDVDKFNIYAVDQDGNRKLVASELSDVDADFITGVHGCLPDLVRRLLAAVDEADRLDLELDNTLGRVFVLETEADEFSSIIGDLTEHISQLESGRV